MVRYVVDLHSHANDFSHIIGSTANKKTYVTQLVEKLFAKGTRIVLGVSNFNDDGRYEKLVDALSLLPKKCEVDYSNKDYFVCVKKGRKQIWFVKSDEVATEKGHILIVGHRGIMKARRLRSVLRNAHKENCVIIANHPLHAPTILYILVSNIIGEETAFSFTEQDLEKNLADIDSLELNSYFPEDWAKVKQFAKKHGLPVVSGSDAHFFNEIFRSHFILHDLDFSSGEAFKQTLHREMKKHITVYAKQHGFFAEYRHGFGVLFWEFFLRKLRIVRD